MKPLKLQFLKSAAKFEQLPPDEGTEIVFLSATQTLESPLIQ